MINRLISGCWDYDFKKCLEENEPKSWLKTVSAFANGIGGSLFFGIDDSGTVVGIDNSKRISDKITELINSRIKPVPNYTLTPLSKDDKTIVSVKVFQAYQRLSIMKLME